MSSSLSTALVPFEEGKQQQQVNNSHNDNNDNDDDQSQMSSLSSMQSKTGGDDVECQHNQSSQEQQHGMEEACRIVQSILDQVTLNDSPPSNDDIIVTISTNNNNMKSPRSKKHRLSSSPRARASSTTQASSTATKTTIGTATTSIKQGLSRQRHDAWQILEESPSAEFAGIEVSSTLSSTHTEGTWQEQYHKLGSGSSSVSEMKMGNASLATLCSRTLDTIQNVEPTTTTTPSSVLVQQEPIVATAAAAAANVVVSPSKSIKQRSWIAKRLQKKKSEEREDHIASTEVLLSESMHKLDIETESNEPLRELDNLPATPVVTNSKRFKEEEEPPALDDEKDDDSMDAIERMRSLDSDNDDEDEEEENVHMLGLESETLEDDESSRCQDDEMADIREETASELAAEDVSTTRNHPYTPKQQHYETPTQKPTTTIPKSPPSNTVKPPLSSSSATPTRSPQLKMYGSEYARFLSSSPFSPQIPKSSRGSSSRHSSLLLKPPISGKSSSGSFPSRQVLNLEDASDAIVTGAITDIVVTHGDDEPPPKGYLRISQSSNGEDFTSLRSCVPGVTTKKIKSVPVYINVKKEASWDKAAQRPCVTALALIFPERKEFVPPGFCVVRHYTANENLSSKEHAIPANLNHGSSGERVYLCYRRSREGNPITGMIPLQPRKGEAIPEGYTVLERSPRNFVADINSAQGEPVFLAFRQRLANLETLRPLSLVLSVHYNSKETKRSRALNHNKNKKRLYAYYCTGGTVVTSNVGRFHIMDRSTHSLLSPSSVSNRISLIESSRKQHSSIINSADIPKSNSSSSTEYTTSEGVPSYKRLETRGHGSISSSSIISDVGLHGDGSILSHPSSSVLRRMHALDRSGRQHTRDYSFSSVSEMSVGGNSELSEGGGSIFSNEEAVLQSCLDAMNFIPAIEDAQVPSNATQYSHNVQVLQSRAAVLTPILTACYTHHGGSALLAVEGLIKLLNETDFFKPDVADSAEADNGTCVRLTLLDLAIQAVCDVATSSARETYFTACVEFVQSAFTKARGKLNTRTVGYAMRFYLFVFYFGASVPSASSSWPMARSVDPNNTGRGGRCFVMKNDDDDLLPNNSSNDAELILTGGAPQAAAMALRELVTLTLQRLGTMSVVDGLELVPFEGNKPPPPARAMDGFVQDLLSELVDGAVNRVDLANYTQLALHQMHRSGGSELFWHDMMHSCGSGLFGDDDDNNKSSESNQVFCMSFALLANLVKVSSTKIRRVSRTDEFVPRDVSSKLLSMELLLHFLKGWSTYCRADCNNKSGKSVQTMEYAIRRLIVPTLLWNTESALENKRVFRRMFAILTELWCTHRGQLKMELGVLMEHLVIKILQLGPHLLPIQDLMEQDAGARGGSSRQNNDILDSISLHQIEILSALQNTWFTNNAVVELFLNYDLDFSPVVEGSNTLPNMPGPQWKICQQLCAVLCAVAEQSSDTIGKQIRYSQTTGVGPPSPRSLTPEKGIERASVREGGRMLQKKAFEALSEFTKSLAETAATAAGKRYRRAMDRWSTTDDQMDPDDDEATNVEEDEEENDQDLEDAVVLPSPRSRVLGIRRREIVPYRKSREDKLVSVRSRSHSPPRSSFNEIVEYWENSIAPERRKAHNMTSPRGRSHSPVRQTTPVVDKLPPPPSTDADLFDLKKDKKHETPTKSSDRESTPNTEETLDVAFQLVRTKGLKHAIEYLVACNMLTPSPRDVASFLRIHSSRLDPSILGKYLGEGGKDGGDIEYRNLVRFNYVRAISFVGMNVEEGLRYFLTNCGFHLPGEAQMIDRIMTTFSQCFWEDNAGDLQRCPFQDQDTVFLISFAIIMLNTDLHKVSCSSGSSRSNRKKMTKTEFLNNLRGVDSAEELTRDYLSVIYDSIEANPIAIMQDMAAQHFPPGKTGFGNKDVIMASPDNKTSINSIINSVKPAEELLRGLSVHEHPFLSIDDFCQSKSGQGQHSLHNLVKQTLSSTWYLLHGVISATLDNAHLDAQGLEYCLDVLKYALCSTIYLNMAMERSAFITQLARFKVFAEASDQWVPSRKLNAYKLEDWYIDLEMDCADPLDEKAKLSALEHVHTMFQDLHTTLKEGSSAKKDMHRVVRHIRNGGFLLNDPSRTFLREGDLLKRSIRTGKTIKYRFFLFSDMLIYAKSSSSENDYKVHEELPLHLMKLVDYFPPSGKKLYKRAIEIHHPRKKFLVVAATVEEKNDWAAALKAAIDSEIQRKARMESARLTSSLHHWGG